MKFRNLSKPRFRNLSGGNKKGTTKRKASKKDINLLTGKPVRRRPKIKKEKVKNTINIIDNAYVNLNVDVISKDTLGIAGSITHLPKDAQTILNNCSIKQVKVTGDAVTYVLNNNYSLKIRKTRIGKHNKQQIVLKHNKEIIIDTLIR